MDREKFIEQLKTAPLMSKSKITKVLADSVDSNIGDGNPRGHRNLIIVMEELAELSKEIAKQLRKKGDYINTLEELADVQIGVYYVQEIIGISDVDLDKAISVKIDRLLSVLQDTGRFE